MAISWNSQDTASSPPSGGINWGNPTSPAAPTASQSQPKQSLSDQIWSGLAGGVKAFGSVTGANAIGESLGTAGFDVGQMVQGKDPFANPFKGAGGASLPGPNPASQVDIPKTIGGYGEAALTAISPEVGGGTGGVIAGTLGRAGANAALGAGIGATGTLAQGDGNIRDIAGNAALGGVLGGGISAASEGVGKLVQNLPTWFAKSALPKLDEGSVPYALDNTKVLGSADSLLKDSNGAIKSYEGQIQSILSHPQYAAVAENTDTILSNALGSFPNSEYSSADLLDNAKNIAPDVKGLINKMEAGQANLQELNTVRKSLDSATKSVYTSINRPPEAKQLGAALAGSLRKYVQSEAPETAPIFSDYSKEIGLNKALVSVVKKNNLRPTFKDLAAGYAGYQADGLLGAVGGIAAERLGGSTGGKLLLGKTAQALSRSAPAVGALIQGAKAPIIGAATQ